MKKIISSLVFGGICLTSQSFCMSEARDIKASFETHIGKTEVQDMNAEANYKVKQDGVGIHQENQLRVNNKTSKISWKNRISTFAKKIRFRAELALDNPSALGAALLAGGVIGYFTAQQIMKNLFSRKEVVTNISSSNTSPTFLMISALSVVGASVFAAKLAKGGSEKKSETEKPAQNDLSQGSNEDQRKEDEQVHDKQLDSDLARSQTKKFGSRTVNVVDREPNEEEQGILDKLDKLLKDSEDEKYLDLNVECNSLNKRAESVFADVINREVIQHNLYYSCAQIDFQLRKLADIRLFLMLMDLYNKNVKQSRSKGKIDNLEFYKRCLPYFKQVFLACEVLNNKDYSKHLLKKWKEIGKNLKDYSGISDKQPTEIKIDDQDSNNIQSLGRVRGHSAQRLNENLAQRSNENLRREDNQNNNNSEANVYLKILGEKMICVSVADREPNEEEQGIVHKLEELLKGIGKLEQLLMKESPETSAEYNRLSKIAEPILADIEKRKVIPNAFYDLYTQVDSQLQNITNMRLFLMFMNLYNKKITQSISSCKTENFRFFKQALDRLGEVFLGGGIPEDQAHAMLLQRKWKEMNKNYKELFSRCNDRFSSDWFEEESEE